MRTIKFKGKLAHSGEWIEGNLIISQNGSPYIIPFEVFEPDGHHLIINSDNPHWVDANSVSEYIGLTDDDGLELFENDIVKYWQPYAKREEVRIIKYDSKFACFGLFKSIDSEYCDESDWMKIEKIVKLGNYLDNSDLMVVS